MSDDLYDLVGASEIADIAGVRASAVANWIRRYDDFPKPVLRLRMGPLWRRDEIVEWLKHRGTAPTE